MNIIKPLLLIVFSTGAVACGGVESVDLGHSEAAATTALQVVRSEYDARRRSVLVEAHTTRQVIADAGRDPVLFVSIEYEQANGRYFEDRAEIPLADATVTSLGGGEMSIILWLDGPPPAEGAGIRSSVELVGANPTPYP